MDTKTDRTWKARAVRRRLADMRLAAQLEERGWRCIAPDDDLMAKK